MPEGSTRIRDHLANERTFLAWIRTALGMIGLGFVLARVGLFLHQLAMAEPVAIKTRHLRSGHEFVVAGLVFILIGVLMAFVSGRLYTRGRVAIEAGSYEPAERVVRITTLFAVLGGLAIAALVVWRLLVPGE